MLMQQNVFSFIVIAIVSVEYFNECNGYHSITLPYNLTRFKRQSVCRDGEFTCYNGQCIPNSKYCDGNSDCSDESDEIINCNTNNRRGCLIPRIQNGIFTVFGTDYTPGSVIQESSIITLECNSGYKLSGSSSLKCVAGLWDIEVPKCAPSNISSVLPVDVKCPAPQIENGKYTISGIDNYVPGDPIPNLALVNFTCIKKNYVLTTKNLVYCNNGKFQSELPKCVRSCVAIFSSSIDVECKLNDVAQNCSENVPDGTIATMKCKTNYVGNSREKSRAICMDGSWDVPPKRCLPESCPAVFSTTSAAVKCELNGVDWDCSKKVPEDTIASIICKPHYVRLNQFPQNPKCFNGSWDKDLKQCVPECGKVAPRAQILSDSRTTVQLGDFPWHVAIYRLKGSLKYICGGSIISENLVLSAAQCFVSYGNNKVNPISEYLVAAGKLYSRWDAPEDGNFAQKRKISKIEIPDGYLGEVLNYLRDIAVIVVEEPFVFTIFVKPVCVDWYSEYIDEQLKPGVLGKVVGWGALDNDNTAQPRSILKQVMFPFIEFKTCLNNVPDTSRRYLTNDKFCAGYTNESNICSGDSGGGMVFPNRFVERYYIQGIVNLGVGNNGSCGPNQTTLLTKVNNYISFLRKVASSNNVEVIKKSEDCEPPLIQNGNYRVITNNEFGTYTSRKPIPNFSLVNITCINSNYVLSTTYSTIYCEKGKYSQEIPKCVLTCKSKFPTSIDVNCKLNGITKDCTEEVREGTIAYMKCKSNFIDKNPEISKTTCTSNGLWDGLPKQCFSPYMCPPRLSTAIDVFCELNGVTQDCDKDVPDGTVSRMKCKENYKDVQNGPSIAYCSNGTWSVPPKTCIPNCDQIILEGQTHVVNGGVANRGDFPWHVALYRQKPQEPLEYKCGGSIISVKIVVSAAHCLTDANNGNIYPVSEFFLAAGKKYSKWDATEDEYYVQTTKVTKIYTPRDVYFGQISSYAGDIAVVIVDKSFTFTQFISPVCVDWNSEFVNQQLTHGTLGKIAGWGSTKTENPTASVTLKQLIIPYVRRDQCVKIVPKHFLSFVTVDKYCAGYTNGSSVCGGDSGGGMVFPRRTSFGIKKYYLQGIISAGPSKDGHCDDYQLGVYTKVNNYITFIKEIEESNRV